MMPILFVCSITFYLLIASNLFAIWFQFFNKYTSRFERRRFSYLMTLIVAAAFWPVVVPIAYMSILKDKQAEELC